MERLDQYIHHGGCLWLVCDIKNHIRKSIAVKERILHDDRLVERINEAILNMETVFKNGHKVMIAGNGGSAADAQHLAGELVSRFYFDRVGLPAVALTTDSSIITAIGNDYGYDKVFQRQVQANGKKGDMFIGISTSGNSENIIAALRECRSIGIITVGLTGDSGGRMAALCDICIQVPDDETPRIQEAHILIGHIICGCVEASLFTER